MCRRTKLPLSRAADLLSDGRAGYLLFGCGLSSTPEIRAMSEKYRTTPQLIATMPRGIPYIVGNEAAERFSYYGMRSILVVFMTKYLLDRSGNLATMSDEEAKASYHFFTMSVYSLPFFGAILADAFLGKFKTIMILSIVYCLGHFTLAIDSTRWGLVFGLGLIALGA